MIDQIKSVMLNLKKGNFWFPGKEVEGKTLHKLGSVYGYRWMPTNLTWTLRKNLRLLTHVLHPLRGDEKVTIQSIMGMENSQHQFFIRREHTANYSRSTSIHVSIQEWT